MPSFSNIGLQEPSTITARVAAVTVSRGSTAEQQEILVLGDSESSLAIARVRDAAPNSTDWGLVTRQVGYVAPSTTVNVSSVGGVVNVAQTSTVFAVQAAQAGTWSVTVSNPASTTVNVSSLGGTVSVAQASTAWAVQLSNYSTTANISSVAGKVAVVNSSAADLNVTVAGYSTTANVSSLAGRVSIAAQHDSAGIINVADSTNNALRVNVVAGAAGGSTQVTVSQLLDSSNGTVAVGDSVNQALRVNVVAGAAGGSTIVTVSTGSVRVHQSTAADLQVTAAQGGSWSVTVSNPASTTVNVSSVAGVVNVAQNSTTFAVQAAQSGTWTVSQSNFSTTVNVSSLAGRVLVDQNSTAWVVQVSSVAGELIARMDDGAGNALESSTQITSSNARGLIVRPVISLSQTYSASTTGQSSATTIFTSNATVRPYVFAYSVTSTLAGPVNWSINKGSTRLWGGVLAAVSSAISGANLAVSPPGFLFAGSTGRPLSFNVESSNTGVNVSIAYWQCP